MNKATVSTVGLLLLLTIPIVSIISNVSASVKQPFFYSRLITYNFRNYSEVKVDLLYLLFFNVFNLAKDTYLNSIEHLKVKGELVQKKLLVKELDVEPVPVANSTFLRAFSRFLFKIIKNIYWYFYYVVACFLILISNGCLLLDTLVYSPLLFTDISFKPLYLRTKSSVIGMNLCKCLETTNFLLVWIIGILLAIIFSVCGLSKNFIYEEY